MIWRWLVDVVSTALTTLIDAFPSGTYSLDLSGVASVIGNVRTLDGDLPVHEALALWVLAFAYSQASLAWDVLLWGYHQFWGSQ